MQSFNLFFFQSFYASSDFQYFLEQVPKVLFYCIMGCRAFKTILPVVLLAFCHLTFGEASKRATVCTESGCRLPECFCSGSRIPKGLSSSDIPQFVMMSFDGSVNMENIEDYEKIFSEDRKNPNGCPIKGLFHF